MKAKKSVPLTMAVILSLIGCSKIDSKQRSDAAQIINHRVFALARASYMVDDFPASLPEKGRLRAISEQRSSLLAIRSRQDMIDRVQAKVDSEKIELLIFIESIQSGFGLSLSGLALGRSGEQYKLLHWNVSQLEGTSDKDPDDYLEEVQVAQEQLSILEALDTSAFKNQLFSNDDCMHCAVRFVTLTSRSQNDIAMCGLYSLGMFGSQTPEAIRARYSFSESKNGMTQFALITDLILTLQKSALADIKAKGLVGGFPSR